MIGHITTKNVEIHNDTGIAYITGDEYTEGSKRFTIDPDSGFTEIQLLSSGIWQPASLEVGSNSLYLGKNVHVEAVGHHIATMAADEHAHLLAHNEFDGQTTTHDTAIVSAYNYSARTILQPDNSGTWTGTEQTFQIVSPAHLLANDGYLQTDTIAASESIRYRIYAGEDENGTLIFDQSYPASQFTASTEVQFVAHGYVEFESGDTYFHKITSDANFSLKMDTTNTTPWFASDISYLREDNLLQTKPWVSGDTWNADDYFIDSRKIYICNTTGVQSGTFASNSASWNVLDSSDAGAETDPIFTAWDKSVLSLSGMTEYRVPFGNATGGLNDSANLTYSDSALRIGNGGIYIDRTPGDSFLAFKKNGSQVGQIRGADGSIDITGSGGTPVHLSVDTTSGITSMTGVDTSNIGNSGGILKLNPDATGIVELFGDADVLDDENGKMLYIWRRAPEGNDYIRFYIDSDRKAFIQASNELTLEAQKLDIIGDTEINGTLTTTGITTLADSSQLATSAAPTSDADIANKKYVDDSISIEDLWNRTDTVLSTSTAGDSIDLDGSITVRNSLYVFNNGDIELEGGNLLSHGKDHTPTNSALGLNALAANVGGLRNNAMGCNALMTNITGIENTAYGYDTLRLCTGNQNIGIGAYSGHKITTGGVNVLVGTPAGYNITTGTGNICVGRNAGANIIDEVNNVYIGYNAGYSAPDINNSTAVGYDAMRSATGAIRTSAFGYAAGKEATAIDCTYLGYGVGFQNTTPNKLFIGTSSGLLIEGDAVNQWLNILGDLNVNDDLTVNTNTLFVNSTTNRVSIGTISSDNILHIYEDNTNESQTAGLKIEQAGIGDAIMHFQTTGEVSWLVGIDHSATNAFRIESSSTASLLFNIDGSIGLGMTDDIVSGFTWNEDSIDTGESGLAGITINQIDSVGDAALNFVVDQENTPYRWTMFVDNESGDIFKLWNETAGDILTFSKSGEAIFNTKVNGLTLSSTGITFATTLALNDGTNDRINVNPTDIRLKNSAGGIILILSDSQPAELFSPDGTDEISVGNDNLQWKVGGSSRIMATSSTTKMYSPDLTNTIELDDLLITLTGSTNITGDLDIDFSGTTTSAFDIQADNLTTGEAMHIESNSADISTRNLFYILNDNPLATGTTALKIQQDSTGYALVVNGESDFNGKATINTLVASTAALNYLMVGADIASRISTAHIYDINSNTGVTAGLTIEQDGTGDAVVQWLLTGGQRYMMGIDNSDGDKLKIVSGTDLSTDAIIEIDEHSLHINGALQTELTVGMSGVQNNLSVTGESTLQFNTSSTTGYLGGLSNGVQGQRITVTKTSINYDLIIQHENGSGTQKIRCPASDDITLTNYGGVDLVFDGTYWNVIDSRIIDFQINTTTSTAGNYNVANTRILNLDTTSSSINVYGFTQGLVGQIITIYKPVSNNTLAIRHDHASGTYPVWCPNTTDINISNYGGISLFFDGAYWNVIAT